jgi:predicted DNA-binding transcriptional regulator AlpA
MPADGDRLCLVPAAAYDAESIGLQQLVDAIVARLLEQLRLHQDRLINLEELAARVGVSKRGAAGLVARGELPKGYLIGGVRRWSWKEVERFLAARQGRRPRRGRGRYPRPGRPGGE